MEPRTTTFTRNVLTLLGGSALAQVVPLLVTPVLTRLYAPEAFGALALLMAIVNPVSLMACGRYELTVPLPREDDDARALVRFGLGVGLITGIVSLVVVLLARSPLAAVVPDGQLSDVLPYVPVLLASMALFQPLNHWLIRKSAFRAMSLNKVVQMALIALSSLAFGLVAWPMGLLVGYALGWAMNVLMVYLQARGNGFHLRPFDLGLMRREAARYRNFPLFNALPAVLHTAALSVPVFVLSARFGDAVTGQFNLSRQVVFLPSTFIAVSFAQVYMQRASATVGAGGRMLPGLLATARLLGLLALAICSVLLLAGPWLFGIVFGEPWMEAGRFARLLAIPIAAQFVVVPLAVSLPALGRIREYSVWQTVYFVAVLTFSMAGSLAPDGYLIGLAAVETLCYLALLAFILHAARHHDAHRTAERAAETPDDASGSPA